MNPQSYKTTKHPKSLARDLRDAMAGLGRTASLAWAQETTAKALGHKDWHALVHACSPDVSEDRDPEFKKRFRESLEATLKGDLGNQSALVALATVAKSSGRKPSSPEAFFRTVEGIEARTPPEPGMPTRRAYGCATPGGGTVQTKVDPLLDDVAFEAAASAVRGFEGYAVAIRDKGIAKVTGRLKDGTTWSSEVSISP